MKGGVILFRGTGAGARRYLESDRSRADEYYLGAGVAPAELSVVDGIGAVVAARALTAVEYAGWVDWIDPLTRARMGTPRQGGEARQGSPRFAEMVVNTPKSLSIAAALHPDVSAALDAAQRDAVAEIRSWLGQHSVTRIGPRGKQEVVPVERLETVAISHKTSRAGDPHRHSVSTSWSSVPGAVSYDVQMRYNTIDRGLTSWSAHTVTGTASSWNVYDDTLIAGTAQVQVRASNSGGSSAWSAVQTATITGGCQAG